VVALVGLGPDGTKAGIVVAVSSDRREEGASASAIAQDAARNAAHPGKPGPISPPKTPLTTGRNQAAPWSSQAPEIRKRGLLILLICYLNFRQVYSNMPRYYSTRGQPRTAITVH